jgi:hypothetical protein
LNVVNWKSFRAPLCQNGTSHHLVLTISTPSSTCRAIH